MYEETKSSIDWKGLFLKVIIAFLIVLIAVTGYKTFKSKDNNENNQNNSAEVSDSKNSATFTSNMDRLRTAGKDYYEKNKEKLPTKKGTTTIVTLNELVSGGYITELTDEEGKKCDGESSYVTATLEGTNTKVKANLVCGNASTYSTVYLNNNTSSSESNSSTTNTNSSSSSSNTTSNSTSSTTSNKTTSSNSTSTTNKTTSTTCKTNCVPSVTVNTNVSQNVTINGTTDNKNEEAIKYTVKFDSNGGKIEYKNQTVLANAKVTNPGTNTKTGCYFKGWYYNGSKYDFNTPVTKNMTLVAYYSCSSNYEDNYEDYENELYEYETIVYTMGWAEKGTDLIDITHTLRLPEELEELDIEKVRIAKITYGGPINTVSRARTYDNLHSDTYIYKSNGWESDLLTNRNNFSTILEDDVDFYYSKQYKTYSKALKNGFDVNWTANDVAKQCSKTFTVNTASNLCAYGIYYNVTWEYYLD